MEMMEKKINKLLEKNQELEQDFKKEFDRLNNKFSKEKDTSKKVDLLFDEIIPNGIKGVVIMDRINLLNFIKMPEVEEEHKIIARLEKLVKANPIPELEKALKELKQEEVDMYQYWYFMTVFTESNVKLLVEQLQQLKRLSESI